MEIIQGVWVGPTLPEMCRISIESYIRQGHEFHLYTYGPVSGIPAGTVVEDANAILPQAEYDYTKFPKAANFTDFFRIKLLYEVGGWYVDIDSICLRPLDFKSEYVFASERVMGRGEKPACSFMRAPAKSEMFEWMWTQCKAMNVSSLRWTQSGMDNLAAAIEKFSMQKYMVRPEVFCPVDWWNVERLTAMSGLTFGPETYVVHLFNNMWNEKGLHKVLYQTSFYGQFRMLHYSHRPRKVLIGVMTCKKNAENVKILKATWIPKAIAAGFDVEIFDGEKLNVPDDYEHLPYKTRAMCQWALDHGYDYMLKADDDNYIFPEKLKVPDGDYAGMVWKANDRGYRQFPNDPPGTWPHPYASGGAYWLSARAMRIVAAAEVTTWCEDRWVGHLLGEAGIEVEEKLYSFFPLVHEEIIMQIPTLEELKNPLEKAQGSIYSSDTLTVDWWELKRRGLIR